MYNERFQRQNGLHVCKLVATVTATENKNIQRQKPLQRHGGEWITLRKNLANMDGLTKAEGLMSEGNEVLERYQKADFKAEQLW